MREFKFRVYDDLLERMYDLNDYFKKDIHFGSALQTAKEIDLKTMQFTGVKDKNGTEIYEGDVIYHQLQGTRKVYYPFDERVAAFGLEETNGVNKGFKGILENGFLYEIIGNIYENPDLLEDD